MLPGLIVLGILCVVLGAFAIVLWSRSRKLAAANAELTVERDERQAEATEALARAEAADTAKVAAEEAAAKATSRADDATARATEAAAKTRQAEGRASAAGRDATAAQREAAEAQQRAEQEAEQRAAAEAARREADEAAASARTEAETAAARAADAEAERAQLVQLLHPDGSWALDHLRLDRLWRDRLSLPGEHGSPLADLGDPTKVESEAVRLAVHVLTEASREETGVVIDLDWRLDQPLPPALASAVVRLAEELVAAARLADGGRLDVAVEDEAVVLRLATEPAIELPDGLASAVRRFEWPFAFVDGVIDARIPLAAGADPSDG